MEFIPASESRWFIRIFKWYSRLLFYRRFKKVWLKQEYQPGGNAKTVYYLNHNSWWDGLIPLLLNEFRFHQQARALMEDEQMRQYPFFRKIGAFSVNRDDPRKAVTSLRYAVQSMQRQHSSLFIYPEGTLSPPCALPDFEGGLAWLYAKMSSLQVDFVPIAVHIHTLRYDKPELHLHVGAPIAPDPDMNNEQKTVHFQQKLHKMLRDLRHNAGFNDREFNRLL